LGIVITVSALRSLGPLRPNYFTAVRMDHGRRFFLASQVR
jgi:hypothetical protein